MHSDYLELHPRAGTKRSALRALCASAALAALLTCPAVAMAADQADAPATVGEVVVTGSLIRGTPPVGSSLISVGQSELKASTAPTVGEFLKNVPQVLGLGVDPGHKVGSGAVNVTYGSSINLRGLGPGATLLLYNGERLSRSGTSAYVDNSSIPGIAVQRIEVVADGASATYGSDAVAGVVNIITRRNVTGLEVTAQAGFADSTSDYGLSAITGRQWSSGGFMVAADYTLQNRLRAADRSFSRSADFRAYGGTDLRNTTCNPGTLTMGGKSYSLPTLTPGANFCDTVQYNDLLPQIKRWTVIGNIHQDLTDKIAFEANGFFNSRDHDYHLATSSVRGGVPGTQIMTVPVTNAYYRTPPGVAPGPQTVAAFLGDAIGNYSVDDGPEETWDLNANLKFDLPRDWLLTLDADIGHNWSKTIRRGVNAAALNAALASSNPATAINPYAPSASTPAAVVAAIQNYAPLVNWSRNSLQNYKAQVDGPLFDLPGGPLKVAAGFEHRKEGYVNDALAGPLDALAGPRFQHTRTVDSFYGELNAPIVSPDNAIAAVRSLTLSLALRTERYNDFGRTTNPKVGATWQPVDGLSIHGSVGRSFRAPDLNTLAPIGDASVVYILPGGPDPKNGGAVSTVAILSGGNPDLQPEKAKTYSVGFDVNPSFLPGFRASINYFNIKYSNVILSLVSQNALAKEALYPASYNRDPAYIQSAILAFIAKGARYNPAAPASFAGITAVIDGTYQNAGITQLSGEDFEVNYRWTVDGVGALDVGTVGTYYNSFKVAASPLAPAIESVNTFGNPPRLRTRSHIGWSDGAFTANAYMNFTSSYKDVAQNRRVKSFTTFDIDASAQLGDLVTAGIAQDTQVILSMSNLFNKNPPFYNGYYGYDPQNASPIGRRFQIVLEKKF